MFEKIGISSGNLKTERLLLNEKGHLKVINVMSYPEDACDGVEEGFAANSSLKRFYGTIGLIKPPKS
jgi:hypothetical protein